VVEGRDKAYATIITLFRIGVERQRKSRKEQTRIGGEIHPLYAYRKERGLQSNWKKKKRRNNALGMEKRSLRLKRSLMEIKDKE